MQVLVGMVVREQLMVILRRALAPGGLEALRNHVIPYEELNRHVVTAAARSLVSEQQLAVLQASPGPYHSVSCWHQRGARFPASDPCCRWVHRAARQVPWH